MADRRRELVEDIIDAWRVREMAAKVVALTA